MRATVFCHSLKPMTRRALPLARPVTVAVVATFVVSACSADGTEVDPQPDNSPGSTPTETSAPPVTDVSGVYDQTVEWSDCAELECATVLVPLNWSDPRSELIEIAINRHTARNPDASIGSLLINPGGPGASGLSFTERFVSMSGENLLDSYDVVGFDPRGIGESTPVQCGTDEEIDAYFMRDIHIETQSDLDAAIQATADFAAQCRELSGPILEHVDTASAARDMDVIRAAVGDEQLNFLGYSYGSQLGANYAQLYPQNVGRVVLDGAFDFLASGPEQILARPLGYELALDNFLEWCDARDTCPFTGDIEEQKEQIQTMMARALDEPYPTGRDWNLNGNLFYWGMAAALFDDARWPELEAALDEVIATGEGSGLHEFANAMFRRDAATGEYSTNEKWAFTAIYCLDAFTQTGATIEQLEDFRDLMDEASPTFGWWAGRDAGCAGWPWNAGQFVESVSDAATQAEPVLVIGTTGDPATPYESSESLAQRLNATLLTYEGEGHTAYGRSNQCIIDEVDGFLVEGVMPDPGTRC